VSDKTRASALELFPSLHKIEGELSIYEELLRRWQAKINLVAPTTMSEIWLRHFGDSAQVVEALPGIEKWVDLGSGGGFPGIVVGLLLKGHSDAIVHLIESDQRKAAFLRAVSRETGAHVEVHAERIEQVLPHLAGEIEAVSARALAPLSRLVEMAREPLEKGAKAVFLKGEEWRDELTAAQPVGNFTYETVQSRTHKRARLIVVHSPSEADFVGRK
jgi:16S rRNA (guanine527-N7)-methyltransferase